jgi:tetratricopeptide (TPR) repeat protein
MPSNQQQGSPRSRQRFFEAILICASLLTGYVVVEFLYRCYLYYNYAVQAEYPVDVVDARLPSRGVTAPGNVWGAYPPSTVFTKSSYSTDNRLVYQTHVHTNNFGWISHHDYSVQKAADEYRIAVVGASLTASVTNETPWADILQQRLNEDLELLRALDVKRISVLNFGLPGASIQQIWNSGAPVARRFSPDLLLVNFATLDLMQVKPSIALTEIYDDTATPRNDARMPPANYAPDLVVDGVELRLTCPTGPRELRNPDCRLHPSWYVAPGRTFSPQEPATIKREVAYKLLMHRVLLSWRPLALLDLIGMPVLPRAHAADGIGTSPSEQIDPRVTLTLAAFEKFEKVFPKLVISHSPLYWHKESEIQRPLLETLVSAAKERNLTLLEMDQYLPAHLGELEWRRWYIFDGHWSDRGAEMFGAALARALRRPILQAAGVDVPHSDSSCAAAWQHVRAAQLAKARGDSAATWRSFEAAVANLPVDAEKHYRQAHGYADCGFVADLRAERAIQLEERGQTELATTEWQQATAMAEGRLSSYYGERADARAKRGNKAGAVTDLSEVIRLDPSNIDAYIRRGRIFLEMANYAEARLDFDVAIAKRPNDPSLLFNRAQTHFLTGDYPGTIVDADLLLHRLPDNAGAYFLRSQAKQKLERFDEALSDINTAIQLMPEHAHFKHARNNILEIMKKKIR